MKCLVVQTGLGVAPAGATQDADTLVALWDDWESAPGVVSIPERLHGELLAIRAEHMAWAYDMGRLPVKMGTGPARELQDWLRCGEEPSMWWCSLLYERHPKMTPQLYTIYKLRCLERLMDAEGCAALHLVGGDQRLRATLAELCAATGRQFSAAAGGTAPEHEEIPLARRLYGLMPAPLRGLARYAHWWWKVRRHLNFAGAQPARVPAGGERLAGTIVTYFPNVDLQAAARGRFRSRYWEGLHDALNACARREYPQGGHFVRWLFIRFPSPELSFAQCLKLRDLFRKTGKDGLSFHYLEEFLATGDLWAALGRWRRLSRACRRIEAQAAAACHFAGSKLNFWRYAKDDWAESFRGWRALERCLQQRAFLRYAAWCGPQRWTLFPLENCPWERMLTTAMRLRGAARAGAPEAASGAAQPVAPGPVIGAQHSSIRPTDFRYFDDPRTFSAPDCALFQPEAIEGNGRSACRQWLEAGMPPARLGEVEALRYLYLAQHKPSAPPKEEALPPQAGEPVDGRHGPRLLLLTSFFRDETEAHLRLFARCYQQGLLEGWNITVKPHPYLPVEDMLRGLLGADAEKVRISSAPLALALAPGVMVWTSNSTTAALEAALKGLALMVMMPRDDFDLCPLQDVPGLARTATPEDVRRHLAVPATPALPGEYLNLDAALPRWRKLLGLGAAHAAE
ncbi:MULTISPECIES: TIGR04326 family surface carbohydrate biosynthesis protein [unclassified Desulfovibrio]|uniref:TIGR04326 family surface carbohydrate biosynthesis protein n=1 Tax=unclassified Desulfovibrio TaxID=2593640 RepID=UPI0013EA3A5A|nr:MULTISPECIES: TIGR04326 family surface carbohydrate biosynthesis protein [unclassified Desulfovibrio]